MALKFLDNAIRSEAENGGSSLIPEEELLKEWPQLSQPEKEAIFARLKKEGFSVGDGEVSW